MASSKLNREDAQEWLESLQQVGEGWYRQVALAVKAGAPKALGMERREFAAMIGQRMIDPREAIIELHNEGHSKEAIADILGVSKDRTVGRILAEEGLIEWTPGVRNRALESGHDVPSSLGETEDGGEKRLGETDDTGGLHSEIERLAVEAKAAEAKRKRETKELRDQISKLQRHLIDIEREARAKAEAELTGEERERARKEAEAWAEERKHEILATLAPMTVGHIVSALQEAVEDLRTLIDQQAVTAEAISMIESAHAGFVDEFNVARMAVMSIER